MSNTNKRPTPETDAEVENRGNHGVETAMADFARRLERGRDEKQHQITMMIEHDRQRLESDSAVAPCDCLTKSPEVKHHKPGCKYRLICERDYAREKLDAMRSAIKETHDEMHELMMARWANLPGRANDMIESVVNKLQPFLQ